MSLEEKQHLLADVQDDNEIITLISEELIKFPVEKKIARYSKLIKTIIDGDAVSQNISLSTVKARTLTKIIEYLKYHDKHGFSEIVRPLKSADMTENVSEFDASFIDVEQEYLFG